MPRLTGVRLEWSVAETVRIGAPRLSLPPGRGESEARKGGEREGGRERETNNDNVMDEWLEQGAPKHRMYTYHTVHSYKVFLTRIHSCLHRVYMAIYTCGSLKARACCTQERIQKYYIALHILIT